MSCVFIVFSFVVFKQKTAYEMRISDWSSDVCSSDLNGKCGRREHGGLQDVPHQNCVPMLKEKSFVLSPGSFSSALAISIRNGPKGEFQLMPKPTDKRGLRSEEHTSELQSLMRISYAVFCLKKKNKQPQISTIQAI